MSVLLIVSTVPESISFKTILNLKKNKAHGQGFNGPLCVLHVTDCLNPKSSLAFAFVELPAQALVIDVLHIVAVLKQKSRFDESSSKLEKHEIYSMLDIGLIIS